MSEPTAAIKNKTRAKKRYLKGKKERRKQRKALVNVNKQKLSVKQHEEDTESDDEEEIEDALSAEEHEPTDPSPVADIEMQDASQVEEVVEPKKDKEKRPKKKRKKEHEVEEIDALPTLVDETMEGEEPEATPHEAEKLQEIPRNDSPIYIPSFPLPLQPPQASKAQVALQGMDQAMLGARIIDPSTTESLNKGDGTVNCLSSRMRKRLGELGITELFAVQTVLIPLLLDEKRENRALYQPYNPPRDICASAPTGSGKTLAYVVPIVEILATRVVTRLRALVILPTRDLVQQVKETFDACCKGTSLKVASVTGQHSFSHEQNQLVGNTMDKLAGGSSKVDILICTPGRLMDHINGTPNFTLQHLRFLVVDEADRLLTQSFQEWLKQVLGAIRPPFRDDAFEMEEPESVQQQQLLTGVDQFGFPIPDAVAPAWMSPFINGVRPDTFVPVHSSCQKLLFSATLTRDPAKIASLELRDPRYIIVRGKRKEQGDAMEVDATDYMETFETPAKLKEWMVVCESINKPLHLFLLAHTKGVTNALVFTKSAESTSRLLQLLAFFEQALSDANANEGNVIKAEAFSSDLTAAQRKTVLEKFKQKQVDMLICSDLISRGMDIPHVSHVVNYDAPIDIRKYIHRVGRTARAGREGDAWSLVEEQEVHHFKSLMKQSNHWPKIKKVKIDKDEVKKLEPVYETALKTLKKHYSQN